MSKRISSLKWDDITWEGLGLTPSLAVEDAITQYKACHGARTSSSTSGSACWRLSSSARSIASRASS